MAMKEIDEGQLETLQAAHGLLNRLGASPKARAMVQHAIKIINPNVSIPEIDAAQPVLEEVKAVDDKVTKLAAEREKEKQDQKELETTRQLQQRIDEGRKRLRDEGFTDEGLAKVEDLMAKEGILNYEAAAALFSKRQPPDEPVTPTNYERRINIGSPDEGATDHRAWLRDPDKQSQIEVTKFLNELRAQRAR